MSAIKNRASLLFINKEVTPGTLVLPSSGGQAVALQTGFTFTPNFNLLQSDEIKNSLDPAKAILGLEQPQASFSHYARHSGVEGQAPNYGELLECLLGSVVSNGTERITGAGSTTTVIALASGGSDFPRGTFMMIKDGTNKYSIRAADSFSTNNVNLGFALANAPASGIGVGKSVNYKPVTEGHPTLSLVLYRGNGGAIEAMAGARVSSMTMNVTAGELINMSFETQGTKYFFNPIEITTSNNKLDFEDDDGTATATIAVGVYRDPHELADAIASAMNTANPGETKTVVYLDASGKYKFTSTGTLFELQFLTGANNANSIDTTIGFTHADKTGNSGATGYTGEAAIALASALTPSYDNADPNVAKNNEVLIGDGTGTTCFCASTVTITVTNTLEPLPCVCAESGVQEYVITGRAITMEIIGLLEAYDADKFKRFRSNADVKAQFNYGPKVGGNWVPGKCGGVYIPSGSITAHELGDNNGIATMQITITAFADSSGNGAFYMGFV